MANVTHRGAGELVAPAAPEGSVWYADSAGNVTALSPGTDGQVLTTAGAGVIPAWETPGAAAVSFLQAGSGAVTRTAQDKARETVSILDFQVTDTPAGNYTAMVNALAYLAGLGGGELRIPARTFEILPTAAIDITFNNLVVRGAGQLSILKNTSVTGIDLFRIAGNAGSARTHHRWQELKIVSNSAAGRILTWAPTVGYAQCSFENVGFQQLNVAKEIAYRSDTDSGFFACRWIGGLYDHGSGSVWGQATAPTVPAFNFITDNNGFNDNIFAPQRINSHFGTVPFFKIENDSIPNGAWHYNNHWRDIECELVRGGLLYFSGAGPGCRVSNVGYFDSDDLDGHLIEIADGSAGKISEQVSFSNVSRVSGTLIGVDGSDVAVTSITRSGTTATVAATAHGYGTGQRVEMSGAVQADYNGIFTVTKINDNSYTYEVANAPATPATGTIVARELAQDVKLSGAGSLFCFDHVGGNSNSLVEVDLKNCGATLVNETSRTRYSRVSTTKVTRVISGTGAMVSSPSLVTDSLQPLTTGTPISGLNQKGYLEGLRLSYLSASTVRINSGSCRSDDNLFNIILSANTTLNIANSGALGLDAGAEANDTWYAVWLIGDSTGVEATSGILSTSDTAPTLPAGYDSKRLLGYVRNDSAGDFLDFVMRGQSATRRVIYDEDRATLLALNGGSGTSFTNVALAALQPPLSTYVLLMGRLKISVATGSATDEAQIRANGGDATDGPFYFSPGVVTDAGATFRTEMVTSGSQGIQYLVSGADCDLDLWVLGYDVDL